MSRECNLKSCKYGQILTKNFGANYANNHHFNNILELLLQPSLRPIRIYVMMLLSQYLVKDIGKQHQKLFYYYFIVIFIKRLNI